MKKSKTDHRLYFLPLALVYVVSLFVSPAANVLSMIILSVLAFYDFFLSKNHRLKNILYHKQYALFWLVFFTVLVSGYNSENRGEWLWAVKTKLPFVFLPIVFFWKGKVAANVHRIIHDVLYVMSTLASIYVLIRYFQDPQWATMRIDRGGSMYTPIDHIHFSIILAYVAISALIFSSKFTSGRRILYLIVGIYFVLFLHFLSVRTGLVLVYAGLLMIIVMLSKKYKKIHWGMLAVLLVFLGGFGASKVFPTLKTKIDYVKYDMGMYLSGKGKNHPDSERIMSYKIAAGLIKSKPLQGYGIGDVREIMKREHLRRYGKKNKYILPHNQYLLMLVGMGGLLSILFFVGLFGPLFYTQHKSSFLVILYIMLALSMMVENTIQRALPTAFFLFFLLLNIIQIEKRPSKSMDDPFHILNLTN